MDDARFRDRQGFDHGHLVCIRYMDLREKLAGICNEAGFDGPVICPYDWRQPVDFVAEAWVAPRIWQHVGEQKKVVVAALKSHSQHVGM